MRHWELSAMLSVNYSCETRWICNWKQSTASKESILRNLVHGLEWNGNGKIPSLPAETSELAPQPTPHSSPSWVTREGQSLMGFQCSCVAYKVPFTSGHWNIRNGNAKIFPDPLRLLSEETDKNCLIYSLERGMERMGTEKMQNLRAY